MHAKPVTKSCESSFEKREHICFGISPFNSYFTESRMEELARWGAKHFASMSFFIPDEPTVFTLEALGYDPEKAAWKARRQCQYLHNKISKAVAKAGFFPDEISEMIINGARLKEYSRYLDLSRHVNVEFESNSIFRNECLEATSWVLEGKVPYGSEITEQQRLHAVKYLLAEIPLFLDTTGILARSSSVFAYHQCIPLIERLMEGQFSVRRNKNQGFLVVRPSEMIPEPPSLSNHHLQT